jgi:serine/threonine protein phosphatase PrpC
LSSTYHLDAVQHSDVGQKREVNEDSFGRFEPSPGEASWERGVLYVVADGMGGHAAGDVASRLAVETILEEYYQSPGWSDAAQGLRLAIEWANEIILRRSQEDIGLRAMGTTVVAAVVQDDRLTLANVGDSRAYLLREGRLQQLTRDHSWVAKAVEEGVLAPDQARGHPDRNVIYRSLGAAPTVEVETYTHTLYPGDRVLLCTDGLTDVMPDDLIAEVGGGVDLAGAADQLVAGANNRGGPDNITVTLLELESLQDRERRERPTPSRLDALDSSRRSSSDWVQPEGRRTVPRGAHLPSDKDRLSGNENGSQVSTGGRRGWLDRLLRRNGSPDQE